MTHALQILSVIWAVVISFHVVCIVSSQLAERAARRRWTLLHPGMPLSRRSPS